MWSLVRGTFLPARNCISERVDKFLVKIIITFSKLQDFETVSQGSRHRSNHTQKNIHSVVAGHQFLQSGYIGPDTGIFPITENVIHPGFCLRKDSTFQQILFSPDTNTNMNIKLQSQIQTTNKHRKNWECCQVQNAYIVK